MSRISWAARLCVVAAVSVVSVSVEAAIGCPFADSNGSNDGACLAGRGTWETSLLARDFGNDGTIDAYYDPFLDLTWLADANFAQTSGFDADGLMPFNAANAWAAGLALFGGSDWRLPTVTPVNGSSFDITSTSNGSTDQGYARTGVGWGNASELGYVFHVHLGNKGFCTPNDASPQSPCSFQPGGGLSNTGPFANLSPDWYWTEKAFGSSASWSFHFRFGVQIHNQSQFSSVRAWAVHDGDLIGPPPAPVPLPGTVWLLGSGLLGVGARARRRAA